MVEVWSDTMFWVALQSALVLGLVHGVNPCGHSWLVLAPLVAGERRGWRVAGLTASFAGGTALACLLIGATLGAVSASIPPSVQPVTDLVTAIIVVGLGLILILRPHLLHSHDHDHCGHDHDHCGHDDHDHDHDDHDHDHDDHDHDDHGHGCSCGSGLAARLGRLAGGRSAMLGLFTIGFVNMIVPCPTVAIMYTYALDSGSALAATLVFGSYAIGTALALGGVIFLLHRAAQAVRGLQKPWVEPLIMRGVGVITVVFGVAAYVMDFGV